MENEVTVHLAEDALLFSPNPYIQMICVVKFSMRLLISGSFSV